LDVEFKNESKLKKRFKLESAKNISYIYPMGIDKPSPIIIGFGPAGMYAAYILAKAGLKPLVFERGESVEDRTQSVNEFWRTGKLSTESNVQFGEGGAGTFSDGKLTSRSKDIRGKEALRLLVEFGAPEEILYSNKPHVGTDILKSVVKNMREAIIRLGGEIRFSSRVDDLLIEDGQIRGVVVANKSYESEHVILAVGHSARDTYEMIYQKGVALEQKPFAMGVRIEHDQSTIDANQYGSLEARQYLGASDYKLTHTTSNGRSVYSFCVCPGGMVVASASEEGGVVVNGMSEHARDQKNINAALLVQVKTEDFGSDHPLAGVDFQRRYERKAFNLSNSYHAPCQTVGSFLRGESNHIEGILPSHKPNVFMTSIESCLPDFIVTSLKEGIEAFGKKIKGFDTSSAILTAIESRSSAPIRMLRDYESCQSVSIKGLYPIGEGAGYAGGIISSAIDGMKIGEIVANA
jgi:uncharacterized FAD-dependent dehydrogenase